MQITLTLETSNKLGSSFCSIHYKVANVTLQQSCIGYLYFLAELRSYGV